MFLIISISDSNSDGLDSPVCVFQLLGTTMERKLETKAASTTLSISKVCNERERSMLKNLIKSNSSLINIKLRSPTSPHHHLLGSVPTAGNRNAMKQRRRVRRWDRIPAVGISHVAEEHIRWDLARLDEMRDLGEIERIRACSKLKLGAGPKRE